MPSHLIVSHSILQKQSPIKQFSVAQDYIGIQMHEGQSHWKSFLLQSDTGAKSGNHREQLGGSTIIQKRNGDGLHQGDDNGSFKMCLDSECSWKDNLICILLSH